MFVFFLLYYYQRECYEFQFELFFHKNELYNYLLEHWDKENLIPKSLYLDL